jgi:hypothetical protein
VRRLRPPRLAGGAPQRNAAVQLLRVPTPARSLDLTKPLTTPANPASGWPSSRRPGLFITHLEGANFPVANGKTDAQAHSNHHDVIELAGVKMEFFLKT